MTEKKIRDLMKSDPVTLEAENPAEEAARLMRDHHIGNVLVMRDGELCGIVTDRDLVVRCLAGGEDPKTTTVGKICSPDVAVLSPDDDCDVAVRTMREHSVRRIPVVEAGKAVGIVSIGDLARDRDRRSVLGEISAAEPS